MKKSIEKHLNEDPCNFRMRGAAIEGHEKNDLYSDGYWENGNRHLSQFTYVCGLKDSLPCEPKKCIIYKTYVLIKEMSEKS